MFKTHNCTIHNSKFQIFELQKKHNNSEANISKYPKYAIQHTSNLPTSKPPPPRRKKEETIKHNINKNRHTHINTSSKSNSLKTIIFLIFKFQIQMSTFKIPKITKYNCSNYTARRPFCSANKT